MTKKMLFGALVLASAGVLGSCSSEDLLAGSPNQKWHATGTVTVGNEDELTRAMSVGGNSGKVLYFNWAGGEQLLVRNASGDDAGTMTATVKPGNTAIATIEGDVTGTYNVDDKVTYYYPTLEMSFTGQKGTIADLSTNFHYMSAPVKVVAVDNANKAVTMGGATFSRRCVVLRLRLTDSNGNRLNIEELEVSAASEKLVQSVTADGAKTYGPLTITAEKEDGAYPNEFLIALLNDSGAKDTYSFTAKVGNSVYSSTADAQKISANLVNGKFYTAVRQLTKTVDGDVETSGDFTFSTIEPQTYTGSALKPAVTVSYNGTEVNSDNYELHYFSNTNAGKAFVVALGKDGTSVADKSGVTTFTINSKPLTETMLSSIADQTYTGSAIEPAMTVTDGSKTLVKGTDYTVTYADNTDVGTATVTVTGTGNYSGELEKTFAIKKATPVITLETTEMKLKPEETGTRIATADFGTISYSSSNTSIATVDANGTVTAVADGTATITASVAGTDNWNEASKQYTVTVSSVTTPEGALNGKFTINASGDKVYFSKGNLQLAGENTWQFADNQWDYFGFSQSNNHRDHFGWGTKDNPNNTSQVRSQYTWNEWGENTNLVSALGSGWRTLESAEWTYVFNTRTTGGTVFGTSSARYTEATINTDGTGVNGIILFPDGVDIASSEVATAGTVNGTSAYATKCTTAQWSALEAKGCVFLPATGRRQGTSESGGGSYGYYWSSTAHGTDYANYVYFLSDHVDPANYNYRDIGCSVRLVRPVE